ncbi:helix-turn-helix protein [Glycomyces artemisiae]|uniref:Helix-turn-helix protein n=2 Tax=Glycomyces artemisiae TaxID=1076443 RepID=A0A2T0UEQ7_9ACTN|nr:helix-turn-helix protein [Glycomyces artemisiae]
MTRPTVSRRRMGIRLQRRRQEIGLSEREVAELLGYTYKSIQRIEKGTQGTKQTTIEKFIEHYKIPGDEASYLLGLRVRGAERGWWEDYIDKGTKEGTRPDFPMFLEYEQIATLIRCYEAELVPGLLQTIEYLRWLQRVQLPIPHEVAEKVGLLRERRQALFANRTDMPQMQFLLGESVIRTLMQLPAEVRDGQLARLTDTARMAGVEIRVVMQLHPLAAGNCVILNDPEDFPPIVYTDHLDGCRYLEDADVTSRYEFAFSRTWEMSVSIEEYLNEHV